MRNRLFLTQEVLDARLADGTMALDGELLTLPASAQTFTIQSAVYFLREVAGVGDAHRLLGRVKDMQQVEAIGGDYAAGTVIVGDCAYEVRDGFVGVPQSQAPERSASGETMASALDAVTGKAPEANELDALAKLFLSTGKK